VDFSSNGVPGIGLRVDGHDFRADFLERKRKVVAVLSRHAAIKGSRTVADLSAELVSHVLHPLGESLSENSVRFCFWGKGRMARRDEAVDAGRYESRASGTTRIIPARITQNLARRRRLPLVNSFPMNRLFFGDNLGWLRDPKEFPAASVDRRRNYLQW
jgi:hypothetical protein